MKQEILELIGYASSVLILISLLMTSVVKFRVLNAVGSVIFTVYAILIHSYPTAALNGCLVAVDLWFLIKALRTRVTYSVEQAVVTESGVSRFLQAHQGDILRFFPEWAAQSVQSDRVYVVYEGMTMAGILAGRETGKGEMEVLLDYSSPQYRDCSVGKALYPALARMGVTCLTAATKMEKHARYLRKMGFAEKNGRFFLDLKPYVQN